MKLLKSILDFFKADKTEYWHRDRSVEVVALENGFNIEDIKDETLAIIQTEGRVEAISKLRHRFHIPLSAAWRFVDKLDNHRFE